MKIYRLHICRNDGTEVFVKDFKKYESAHLSGVMFAKALVNRRIGLRMEDPKFVPVEPKSYDADDFTIEIQMPSVAEGYVALAYRVQIRPVDVATEFIGTEDFEKLRLA